MKRFWNWVRDETPAAGEPASRTLYLDGVIAAESWLDGDVTAIREGDCFKVDPPVRRCLKAGPEGLRYVCIQARAGSLAQYTMTDGKIVEGEKPRW